MARQRPTASDDQKAPPRTESRAAPRGLTRAEARALSRSAPLTRAEFHARRRLAERSLDPLPMLLDREPGDRPSA